MRLHDGLMPSAPVGVVIPCHNYGAYLEEAVGSVRRQTIGPVPLIIVDDGSDDATTLSVIARMARFARIIRETRMGPAAARNRGIRELSTRYICCLDADDMLEPTYLEKAVRVLEQAGVHLAYSWVQAFGEADWIFRTEPLNLATMLTRNQVSCHAVFRRAAWERAGGYDETMRVGHEDWEFWTHLAAIGCQGAVIPETLLRYRRHGASRVFASLKQEETFLALLRSRYGRFCVR